MRITPLKEQVSSWIPHPIHPHKDKLWTNCILYQGFDIMGLSAQNWSRPWKELGSLSWGCVNCDLWGRSPNLLSHILCSTPWSINKKMTHGFFYLFGFFFRLQGCFAIFFFLMFRGHCDHFLSFKDILVIL